MYEYASRFTGRPLLSNCSASTSDAGAQGREKKVQRAKPKGIAERHAETIGKKRTQRRKERIMFGFSPDVEKTMLPFRPFQALNNYDSSGRLRSLHSDDKDTPRLDVKSSRKRRVNPQKAPNMKSLQGNQCIVRHMDTVEKHLRHHLVRITSLDPVVETKHNKEKSKTPTASSGFCGLFGARDELIKQHVDEKSRKQSEERGQGVQQLVVHTKEQNKFIQFARIGNLEEMKSLFRSFRNHGLCVNALGSDGLTALHAAASEAKDCVVEFLIKAGADPSIKSAQGLIAVDYLEQFAEAEDDNKMFSARIRRCHAMLGTTSIYVAAYQGDQDRVKWLLDLTNSPVDVQNKYGMSALHFASLGEDLDTFRFLVSRGADMGLRNHLGQTPLQVCSEEFVELIHKHAS